MKALIIAAGRGKRLSQKGYPKPLLPLLGLTLIERTILTGARAGLQEFFIVTGYEGEMVEDYLSHLALQKNLRLHFLRNDEWESKGNGVSVLKAKDFLDENFILLMTDHIFEETTLIELMNKGWKNARVVLASDFNIENKLIDVNDVTKVFIKNNVILDIGKEIKKYNAFDTGMFLCSPGIFHALEESSQKGNTSLSGGVRILAREGTARAFNIKNHLWMDIDTPKDLKNAQKVLYRTLPKPHDGWISRKINRKLSSYLFTPLILKLFNRITPNAVSVISALVGLLAGMFFFFHRAVTGGILIQLASVLDGCDGEVARLKKMESSFGNFFDAVLDRYTDFFILLGMFFYSLTSREIAQLFGSFALPAIFLISGLAMVGYVMVSYTSAKSVVDFRYRYKGRWTAAGRGRDIRLFMLFVGGVMASVHPVSIPVSIFGVAVFSNAIVLKRVLLSWKYSSGKDVPINRSIRAVVFDLDGTLADTMTFLTNLAAQLLIDNYGLSEEEARSKYLETTGLDFATQMSMIFPNHPKNEEVISAFEKKKAETVMELPLFSDVIPTLRFFKKREISLFVCSSTPHDIIDEYLKLQKIDWYVDGHYGLKPAFQKSKQIDFILRRYRLRHYEVLFVGDSLKDGELAKNKKIGFAGISRLFSEKEFQKKGQFSIRNLTALVRLWRKSERIWEMLEVD